MKTDGLDESAFGGNRISSAAMNGLVAIVDTKPAMQVLASFRVHHPREAGCQRPEAGGKALVVARSS